MDTVVELKEINKTYRTAHGSVSAASNISMKIERDHRGAG